MNKFVFLIFTVLLVGCNDDYQIDDLDTYTREKIGGIIHQVNETGTSNKEDVIAKVSRSFLGTPYVAGILIGSSTVPEKLVIDVRQVDCFTFLDYVEALRKSSNRDNFVQNLIHTRYAEGKVDFRRRKHFFTDWAALERVAANDVTRSISQNYLTVTKHLNRREDGGEIVPGLGIVERQISYIPANAIDETVIARLRDGDYIGAYSPRDGLDVTHVGIFLRTADGPVLRNASSLPVNRKVVDSPFLDYVTTKPGIVVLRAL